MTTFIHVIWSFLLEYATKSGAFYWSRFKLIGPDGSRYWIAHDAHMGGSDPDDVWSLYRLEERTKYPNVDSFP